MKPYQLEGLRWMVQMYDNGLNGIMGDEMGLGKTLQTISLLTYLKFERNINGPHLIICPLSVLEPWMSELKKWSPQMTAIRFHAQEDQRHAMKQRVASQHWDIVLTTVGFHSLNAC